jgi:predicted nucleotidyltransferase
MSPAVTIPHADIAQFCRTNRIARLSLFGSVLRKDFCDDSDVDILAEFQPGARVGYLAMARMAEELSQMLGRSVDLHTAAELHPSFRQQVLAEAQTEYVAA